MADGVVIDRRVNAQTDHDTLIRIETLLATLSEDVKRLSAGTNSTLLEHERRIRNIEDLIIRLQPDTKVAQYDATNAWVDNFKAKLAVYVAILAVVVGIITTAVAEYIKSFFVKL